jgi:hypothetical protein
MENPEFLKINYEDYIGSRGIQLDNEKNEHNVTLKLRPHLNSL